MGQELTFPSAAFSILPCQPAAPPLAAGKLHFGWHSMKRRSFNLKTASDWQGARRRKTCTHKASPWIESPK